MTKKNSHTTIVVVTECPYSGILRSVVEHAKLLTSLGFTLFFIVPQTPRDRYGERLEENKKLLRQFGEVLTTPLRRKYRTIWKDKDSLQELLPQFNDCIVMSYTGYAGKLCRLLFKEKKITTLYHVPQCIDIVRRPWWQKPFELFAEYYLAKHASYYIACSKSEEAILNRTFKINQEKIITVPNYIIQKENRKNNAEKKWYVILGRVSKDKRIEPILEAAKDTGILNTCIVIGDGLQLNFLKQKYPEATFTGHIDNSEVFKFLSQAKYIISNSMIEGLPFAVIEAMQMGVVPLLSNIPAHRDLISGESDGFLFKNKSELKKILEITTKLTPAALNAYSEAVTEKMAEENKLSQKTFLNHFKHMEKETKKIYLGVYGIYQKDDTILVIKKARGPYTGKYDLPGGGLNFDETREQCLERELLEETNTKVKDKVLVGINEYQCHYTKEDGTPKDFHHLGIYYKVDLIIKDLKTSPDGQDSNGAIFVHFADLTEKNTSPIALPMIKQSLA